MAWRYDRSSGSYVRREGNYTLEAVLFDFISARWAWHVVHNGVEERTGVAESPSLACEQADLALDALRGTR